LSPTNWISSYFTCIWATHFTYSVASLLIIPITESFFTEITTEFTTWLAASIFCTPKFTTRTTFLF
jgi:hypothetical protein